MPSPTPSRSVLVIGGYGTFGSIVARELSRTGIAVAIAGRDRLRAERFARTLDGPASALRIDATDARALREAIPMHAVAILAAGPWSATGPPFLEAALFARRHAIDLAEDRAHAALARKAGPAFRERGTTLVTGASSLPGLSQALASSFAPPIGAARVALFIGNDNPKGPAAIEAAIAVAGRRFETPQGTTLVGFRDGSRVDFPPPIGRRAALLFDSPEYELFPEDLLASSVEVRVAFDSRAATLALRTLAAAPRFLRPVLGAAIATFAPLAPRRGSSGGAVQVEIARDDGSRARAALVASANGQRLAALPAILAARALLDREDAPRGGVSASGLLGAEALLAAAVAAGFTLVRDDSREEPTTG